MLIVCWLLGYAGLIYGVGAFTAVFMVDHGATPHFVFLSIAGAYALLFVGFQINSWLGERVERRDVLCFAALLFAAAWIVIYLHPTLPVIAAFYAISRVGTGLYLFNLYNYTAVAYPTRIRSIAFEWTDGLGHLGAWGGVTLLGPLYMGPKPFGLVSVDHPAGFVAAGDFDRGFGIRQRSMVLEQVST